MKTNVREIEHNQVLRLFPERIDAEREQAGWESGFGPLEARMHDSGNGWFLIGSDGNGVEVRIDAAGVIAAPKAAPKPGLR